jgi:hypothetical protein
MKKSNLFLLISFILMVALIATILILFIISPIVKISLIPPEYVFDFVNIIPGPIYTDMLILLLLPLLVGGFYILIAPWLVSGLYRINRLTYIFRKAPNYGIFDKGSEIKFSTYLYRSLIIGLFTFGTSTILVNLYGYGIFRVSFESEVAPGLLYAEGTFFGCFFLTFLSLALFMPVWILEDCGLVEYRIFEGNRKTPLIQGIHKFYSNVLEVYSGFSTISGYFILITKSFIVLHPGDPALLTPIVLIFLPIILTGFYAIPLFIYEKRLSKIQSKIHNHLHSLGIYKIIIPSFEDLKSGELR